MHGYGAYQLSNGTRGIRRAIGSAQVTYAHFADVWRRISAAFKEDPGVTGYGIMNEPVAMPSSASLSAAEGRELVSQKALDAIRDNDDTHPGDGAYDARDVCWLDGGHLGCSDG